MTHAAFVNAEHNDRLVLAHAHKLVDGPVKSHDIIMRVAAGVSKSAGAASVQPAAEQMLAHLCSPDAPSRQLAEENHAL